MTEDDPGSITDDRLYTRQFFQVFAAAGVFMTAVALQFHFGQYVEFLGHKVDTLGRILSISMVGTLAIRLHIGRWIDRFGCRPVWLVGTMIFACCTGSIQFAGELWVITALRACSAMALAAVMTTVAVFAAQIAPPHRRAESLGTIGLAGFVGMIVGPTLGDSIFAGATDSITPYRVFFTAGAGFSTLAGLSMLFFRPHDAATESVTRAVQLAAAGAETAPLSQRRHILRHWPGAVLLVGITFGMGFCWQSMFLERLAEARGFRDIKLFFLIYCPTAIVLRIVFRRLPQQLGRTRTVVLGMMFLAAGQLCMTQARSQVGLLLPGLLMGAGHCFVFPSMVDLGADRFPTQFRGTGTSLILGAGDVGMIVGYATLGELIDRFGFNAALMTLAGSVVASALLFAIARRHAMWRGGKGSRDQGI